MAMDSEKLKELITQATAQILQAGGAQPNALVLDITTKKLSIFDHLTCDLNLSQEQIEEAKQFYNRVMK